MQAAWLGEELRVKGGKAKEGGGGRNLKFEVRDLKSEIRNLNLKPETRNHNFETRNLKSEN